MSLVTRIVDSLSNNSAKVTKFGQLVVSPIDYSVPSAREMITINTAFNFVTPTQDQQIVITDIVVSADRNVSANTPADVEIYEADSVDSLVPSDSIIRTQLLRATNIALTGLNLIVGEGKWLNAKTDDAGILLTIMFYKVPVR